MSLIPISQLPPADYLAAVFRRWCAIDLESGAHLSMSHGNTSKAPRYVLILPNRSVEARGGLFASYNWDYPRGRKFLRAWTVEEAIKIANVKLAKMLEERRDQATSP